MVIQTTYSENLFFVFFKKHFCPHCGERLERSYIWEVLPEKSMAAKRYRAVGDTTYSGDVQLRTGCFYCGKCKKKNLLSGGPGRRGGAQAEQTRIGESLATELGLTFNSNHPAVLRVAYEHIDWN